MAAVLPVETESLPSRPEAERSLLGSLLIDGGLLTRVMEHVIPEDFASEPHRLVYEACLALSDRKEAVDLVTVQAELERHGRLERCGGAAYLAGLLDNVPDVESVESYARLVREASLRRQLILQSRRAARAAVEAPDAQAVLEVAQQELVDIAKGSLRGGFVRLSDIAEKNEEEIQKIQARGSMLTGLPTGFAKLNALTQGMQRTDLIVLAARPGMGKTAFALNIASYLTIHSGYCVAFFSLEMSAPQLGFRIQCAEARVNLQRLREGGSRRRRRSTSSTRRSRCATPASSSTTSRRSRSSRCARARCSSSRRRRASTRSSSTTSRSWARARSTRTGRRRSARTRGA